MAYNVKFLKGTAAQYNGLASNKDANTFYYVDNKDLYLGSIKLSNAEDLAAAIVRIAANETHIGNVSTLTTTERSNLVGAVNEIKAEIKALVGGETGGITEMIKAVTGDLSTLTTEARGTLVAAINELDAAIDANAAAAAVTIDSETTTTTGMLKSYTVKQGNKQIGIIDIPKDMVVKSGEVKVNPEGQTAGKYIVLTLANATEDKIYVNVGTLVDIYTAKANAAKVQLTINPATREISADIVAGSIGTADLAANAITTDKIADKNVTKAKLADDVQASLGKADSAVQTIAESTVNGSILVDGKEVAVHGLGTAAYADTNDFEAAGTVKQAYDTVEGHLQQLNNNLIDVSQKLGKKIEDDDKTNLAAAKSYTDTSIQGLDADVSSAAVEAGKGIKVQVVETDGKVTSVAVSGDYSNTYDALGAATTAETNAKTYTDNALTWNSIA